MKKYRPNVALILEDRSKEAGCKVLIGERLDAPGSWQFPQGGAKPKERLASALQREAEEEIALSPGAYQVFARFGPYRYLFPKGRVKEGFVGQEQTYFLARLLAGEVLPEGTIKSPEFSCLRWISPHDFDLAWVAPFKREVYRQVFWDIWHISFPDSAVA